MESLVLRYREVFHHISRLTGAIINGVHVLGGGSRNTRLNQWLADALDVPVIAGPYEATAHGNALMQLGGPGRTAQPGGGAHHRAERAHARLFATDCSTRCLE